MACGHLFFAYFAFLQTSVLASIVDTQYGQVSGHFVNVDNGKDPVMPVEVFYGIPFAKDTSGQGRFANPQPCDPWSGVFDAITIGSACPQGIDSILKWTHPGWTDYSEDCLNLNVYTKNVTGGPYAVMLWFHGGGYNSGANFQYPGHFMATYDIVMVTANYRLNKFGFAYSGNEACPGNAGLWDQNVALKWVVDNIGNFGGDPNKITVFGQSAGASSSALHVLSPHSKDLFQQAIMESGAENDFWAIQSFPKNNVERMADGVGCLGANDTESIECMRQLSWQIIYDNATCGLFSCSPVVDGFGGFIPDSPRVLREEGDIMMGPILAGITHDDGAPYMVAIVPETLIGCCNRSYYERVIMNRLIKTILNGADNKTQQDCYEAIDYNYSPWPYLYDNYKNRESLETLVTDVAYGYGWDMLLKDHQAVAPTYGYVYNYRGRNSSQIFPEWMGVPHIGEIPYVWGLPMLLFPSNHEVRDDSKIEFDAIYWTEEDVLHALFAMELWANFAKYGNPTPQPVDNPIGGTTVWPQFTWDNMNVMEIKNTSIDIIQGYLQKDYAFWTNYMPYVASSNINDLMSSDDIPDYLEDAVADPISWLLNMDEDDDFMDLF